MGYFTDEVRVDGHMAVAALKWLQQALNNVQNITVGPEFTSGVKVQTDEDILTFIRNSSISFYHAGGMCTMGKVGEKGSVMDIRARVIGMQGLRVIDMSALLFVLPEHLQAMVYGFAEKIADEIRKGL